LNTIYWLYFLLFIFSVIFTFIMSPMSFAVFGIDKGRRSARGFPSVSGAESHSRKEKVEFGSLKRMDGNREN
jgi:hypothetical protein